MSETLEKIQAELDANALLWKSLGNLLDTMSDNIVLMEMRIKRLEGKV